MTNDSNTPITAKVFAEALTVEENGNKKRVINPDKLFIGYAKPNLKSKGTSQQITVIQGSKVTSKLI